MTNDPLYDAAFTPSLAIWRRVARASDSSPEIWAWLHAITSVDVSDPPMTGWETIPEEINTQSDELFALGQFAPIIRIREQVYMRTADIKHSQEYPVILVFGLSLDPEIVPGLIEDDVGVYTRDLEFLPPPTWGMAAIIRSNDSLSYMTIGHLSKTALSIQKAMSEISLRWARATQWAFITPEMDAIFQGDTSLSTSLMRARRAARTPRTIIEADKAWFRYTEARQLITATQADYTQRLYDSQWLADCAQIHVYAKELAEMYARKYREDQEFSQNTRKHPRSTAITLPDATHITKSPSDHHVEGLTQSFHTQLQASLLAQEESVVFRTPNTSDVEVSMSDQNEQIALTEYIMTRRGPDGLKHMLALTAIYDDQTHGKGQREDAHISPRQLVTWLYGEDAAGDPEKQQHAMEIILYLARATITSQEKRYNRKTKQYDKEVTVATPMIVQEKWEWDQPGKLRIPSDISFHLGEHYYNLLYGPHPQYFALPTQAVLQYHSQRQEDELLLVFYLSNHISMTGKKPFKVHLSTLMHQSTVMSEDNIQHGDHRTRDALAVIYALEQIERDQWIIRSPDEIIDEILLCDILLAKTPQEEKRIKDQLTVTTYERLLNHLQWEHFSQMDNQELIRHRLKLLQRLLTQDTDALIFMPGELLQAQVHKRISQRCAALIQDETAMTNRVIRNATRRIVDSDKKQGKLPKK